MSTRIEEELALLRRHFPDLEYRPDGQWIRVNRHSVPSLWEPGEVSLCFQVPVQYPANPPYGFYVSPVPRLTSGAQVQNCGPSSEPPFAGAWLKFSWSAREWRPTADLQSGSNLLNYVWSFRDRLEEGA
jgi:hypothetical protein